MPENLSSAETSHSRLLTGTGGSHGEKIKERNINSSIQIAHKSVHQSAECYYNSDGELESGTLESLIEVLLINPKGLGF